VIGVKPSFGLDGHQERAATSGGDALAGEQLAFETQSKGSLLEHQI
jgi:hypothetical protein